MSIYEKIASNPNVKGAVVDENGNALIHYFSGTIELTLATEGKPRRLGHVKDKVFFVERSLSKHLHRKSNSYGFNYYFLKKSKSFTQVCLMEDGENFYSIPRDTITSYGKVLHFKNSADGNSFELQIFLNRDIITRYKKNVDDLPVKPPTEKEVQTLKDGI